MIWANEAGVSVYTYEAEHERRRIEIHGLVNDYEQVLASATIEKHNRNRFAKALSLLDSDSAAASGTDRDAERVAMEGIKEGLRQRDQRAATAMRDKCVDAIKSLRATPHGAAYNNAINDAISKIESLTLDQVKPGET